MKILEFKIKGNHKDIFGNAVPKLKQTGNQHWTERAKEYVEWKNHVVASFLGSLQIDSENYKIYGHNYAIFGKPIVLAKDQHAIMSLMIMWKNFTHGDPENIFGSVADALFHNDKNLDVRTLSRMSQEKHPYGFVNGKIAIYDSEEEKFRNIIL